MTLSVSTAPQFLFVISLLLVVYGNAPASSSSNHTTTAPDPEKFIVCERYEGTCSGNLRESNSLVLSRTQYRPNLNPSASTVFNFTGVANYSGHFIQPCDDRDVEFSDLGQHTLCDSIMENSATGREGQFTIEHCHGQNFRELQINLTGLILFHSPTEIHFVLIDYSKCSCRSKLDNCSTALPSNYTVTGPTFTGDIESLNSDPTNGAHEIHLEHTLLGDYSYSLGVVESCFTEDVLNISEFNISRSCDFSINATSNTITVNESCGGFEGLYIRQCDMCQSATIFLVDYADCDQLCDGSCSGTIEACALECLSLGDIGTPSLIPAAECQRQYCVDLYSENCSELILSGALESGISRICQRVDGLEIIGNNCPQELLIYCDEYLGTLLNNLTDTGFGEVVGIIIAAVEADRPVEVVRRIDLVLEALLNTNLLLNENNLLQFAEIFSRLLADTNWNTGTEGAIAALDQIERLGRLVNELLLGNFTTSVTAFLFIRDNFHFTASTFNGSEAVDSSFQFSFESPFDTRFSAQVDIPLQVLCQNIETQECFSAVSLALANNLAGYVHERLQFEDSNNMFQSYETGSELLSLQVGGVYDLEEVLADSPIDITLTLSDELTLGKLNDSNPPVCVFWNYTERSWSVEGVETIILSNTTVMCRTSHLTSFAVLVSLSNNTNTLPLQVISYIGISISIVCLTATIICLLVFKKMLNKGPLLYVHLNLSIALLLAYIVFIAGVGTAAPIEGLCIFVAALAQYLFLASFCWMMCEAIMLYILVFRVFGSASQNWYWLLLIGWVLPLPIPVISAAVLQSDYISSNYCWLPADYTKPAIWTFVVPMLLIIVFNTVVLIMTVVTIVKGRKYGGAEGHVKTKALVVSAIQGTVILLPLLGITWLIGLFAINQNTQVFAWLFVLCNSLQGLFIFVFHVLRNKALWKKIKEICCLLLRSKPTQPVHPLYQTESLFLENGYTTNSPAPVLMDNEPDVVCNVDITEDTNKEIKKEEHAVSLTHI